MNVSLDSSFMSLEEQEQFAMIVYVDGNCQWANRLAIELFMGTALLKQFTMFREFYDLPTPTFNTSIEQQLADAHPHELHGKFFYVHYPADDDVPDKLQRMSESGQLECAQWMNEVTELPTPLNCIGMTPWVHYLPVDYMFNNLPELITWGIAHPRYLRQLVKNMHRYAEARLNPHTLIGFANKLLREYARLLTFNVTLLPNATTLADSSQWYPSLTVPVPYLVNPHNAHI